MIYKSALIVAGLVALFAIFAGKNIVRQRKVTLNGLHYDVTVFSNRTMEIFREDGLRFSIDELSNKTTLIVGTEAQLADALAQMKKVALEQLQQVPA